MMKRVLFLFLLLGTVLLKAGTKEDIERLHNDLLLMQKKIEGLSTDLLNLSKKIEIIEGKIEGIQRASQTADIRVEIENLRIEVERLNGVISNIKETQSYLNRQTEGNDNSVSESKDNSTESAPEKLYQTAYSDYIKGTYQIALLEFQKFIEIYPDNPLVENCLYWIGECYYGLKDYGKAKESLENVTARFPKGAKYYSAKLKLALVHYNLGEKEIAKKMLAEIVKEVPMSTEAGVAREKLRTLFQD